MSRLCQTDLIPYFGQDKYSLDKDNSVDLISLALSKAFGVVTHGELFTKLKRMRISKII